MGGLLEFLVVETEDIGGIGKVSAVLAVLEDYVVAVLDLFAIVTGFILWEDFEGHGPGVPARESTVVADFVGLG